MKKHSIISALCVFAAGYAGAQITVTIGGPSATKDVTLTSSWVVNDLVYDLGTLNGGSRLDWENINNPSLITDNGTDWDWIADAGPNYTNGRMFIYDQSIDLTTLGAEGMADVAWTADFLASTLTNWIPVMEINDGVDTRYYAWDVTGNHWNSNNLRNFANRGAIGQASNWGEIQTAATSITAAILDTGDGGSNPAAMRQEILDFDGTNWVTDGATPGGIIRFGFLQWGSSSGGTINATVNIAIESFEVTISDTTPIPDGYIGGGTGGATPDVTDVTLWTTGDVAYKQDAMVGVDDGYQGNWENVVQNTSVANGGTNVFDQNWEASTDFTIGHIYMWNQESIDLSTLSAGITGLGFKASFTASFNSNWIPIIAVENAGVTTFYRSSESGNVWKGTGVKTFRNWKAFASPGDWSGLVETAVAGMNDTRDSGVQPHLRPTYEWNFGAQMYDLIGGPTGTATFGFMQWGASTGGDIDPPVLAATLAIDSFEVVIYSDNSLIVEPPAPQGLAATGVDSSTFLYKYEMDVDPATQDLDGAGFPGIPEDWRPYAGVLNFNTIQTFVGGVGFSNQNPSAPAPDLTSVTITPSGDDMILNWTLSADAAVEIEGSDDLVSGFVPVPSGSVASGTNTFTDVGAKTFFDPYFYQVIPQATFGVPENLIRNDDDGSLFRESLQGSDFTMEVRARVIGPKDGGDVGILGLAVNPGDASTALRMQIDLTEVSQNGTGSFPVPTSDNDDVMHTYRIAYIYADDYFFVWRDGVLIYGDNTDIGIHGSNGNFGGSGVAGTGATWIGDFSGSLSGEWEIDYIRLHNDAVAP